MFFKLFKVSKMFKNHSNVFKYLVNVTTNKLKQLALHAQELEKKIGGGGGEY